MRRCFFSHSNKNDINTSERFQEINLEQYLTFFHTLFVEEWGMHKTAGISYCLDDSLSVELLERVFNKITCKKVKNVLNYYEFLETIRKISVKYYLKRISYDNIP